VDYLLKPIEPEILRAKARFCLDLHRARKEALVAEQRSAFLARASVALSESLDYHATLAKIANLVVPTIADWCTVILVEEDKSLRRLAFVHQDAQKQPLTDEYQKRFPPAFDKSAEFRTVIRRRKAVRMAKVTEAQVAAFAQDPAQLSILRELGVGSCILAPLSSRENLIGVITLVRSHRASPFQEADLALAEDLASRAALAIENARLYEGERRRADFEQQLIGIVSHDLRNPLSVIAMGAAAIERSHNIDERSKRSASRIRAATERANHLIRDLLDFTQARRAGGIPIRRNPVDIHLLTKELIEDLATGQPPGRIALLQSGDGFGNWDANRVQQIIENLTQNALKYGSPETPIRVETRGEDKSVLISVHNQGDPIAAELLPQLFKPMKGVPGEVDRTNRSIGLGLYIVHQIVVAHGGLIEVSSSRKEGTMFVVRLPKEAPMALVEPIERRNLPRGAALI
jgi:K+-sensing histidine kinase KdpD